MDLLLERRFWMVTAVVALLAGGLLRHWDLKVRRSKDVDLKQGLTLVQVVYSALLAYPFCVLYLMLEVWLDN